MISGGDKLPPCPFCGATVSVSNGWLAHDAEAKDCIIGDIAFHTENRSRKLVSIAWSTRATVPAPQKENP